MQINAIRARRLILVVPVLLLISIPLTSNLLAQGDVVIIPQAGQTFAVNTTADTLDASPGDGICADSSGDCSLRAAIGEANATDDADTIDIPAGTYVLTRTGGDEDQNLTDDLDILKDLTITGAGPDDTVIDAEFNSYHVIDIAPGVPGITVSISGVRVTGAHQLYEGAINSEVPETVLTLDNVIAADNYSSGLLSTSSTNVSNSSFLRNQHNGIDYEFTTSHAIMGNLQVTDNGASGIYNNGTMTVLNSLIARNHADNGAGFYDDGTATIRNTIIAANTASNQGGGLYSNSGNTTIGESVISDNSANLGGAFISPTP